MALTFLLPTRKWANRGSPGGALPSDTAGKGGCDGGNTALAGVVGTEAGTEAGGAAATTRGGGAVPSADATCAGELEALAIPTANAAPDNAHTTTAMTPKR